MAETAIDLRAYHRREEDGSHTVCVEISGLPNMECVNRVSVWMRDMIRANASEIGWLDRNPLRTQ